MLTDTYTAAGSSPTREPQGNTMTETEKLKACPWCGSGNSIPGVWFDDMVKAHRVSCGRCGSGTGFGPRWTADEAITAWNTRPDEEEPVAWREAVAALTGLDDDEWEVLQAHCPEDLRRRAAGLFARPAPALDREGEVKQALKWLQYALTNEWTPDSHALAEHSLDRATKAILSMVGGGVPAEPTQPAYRYQDDSAVNPSMLSVSSTVEG
jgi:hypothetical protein